MSNVSAAHQTRDLVPDVLRGFALLGILLVNLAFFSHSTAEGISGENIAGAGNTIATLVVVTLFQGKFYLLFSFLFGYSSHYVTKGQKEGVKRWSARSILLITLGALHFTFLWHGDILFLYGWFGLLLILFLFRSDRTLSVWAWVLWAVSTALFSSLTLLVWWGENAGFSSEPYVSPLDEVMRSGTFLEAIAPRLELWTIGSTNGLLLQGGLVFAAFLLGVRAARHSALSTTSAYFRPRPMMGWGFGLGIPLQIAAALIYISNELGPSPSEAVYLGSLALGFMTAPLVTMGYIGALIIALRHAPRVVSWLRFPGQMALSNYIGQSVALSFLYGNWGLGLFEQLDYWQSVVLALGLYAAFAAASAGWLSWRTQGPLEWMMTSATARWRPRATPQ